jgi:hypothetical protein
MSLSPEYLPMSSIAAFATPAERTLQRPQGIAQDFHSVRDLSNSIADGAASFRTMAKQLGDLVAALDR